MWWTRYQWSFTTTTRSQSKKPNKWVEETHLKDSTTCSKCTVWTANNSSSVKKHQVSTQKSKTQKWTMIARYSRKASSFQTDTCPTPNLVVTLIKKKHIWKRCRLKRRIKHCRSDGINWWLKTYCRSVRQRSLMSFRWWGWGGESCPFVVESRRKLKSQMRK